MNKIKLSQKERKNIGGRLKYLAESQGWTWDEMERHLHVSKGAIKLYESGTVLPQTTVALRYRALLDRSLEDIFGDKLGKRYEAIKVSEGYKTLKQKRERCSIQAKRMRKDRRKSKISLDKMVSEIKSLWNGNWPGRKSYQQSELSYIENGIFEVHKDIAHSYAIILKKDPDRYVEDTKIEKHGPKSIPPQSTESAKVDIGLSITLENAIKTLGEKEVEILNMRYGRSMMLEEIGIAMGLTRERIRQIEVQALERLRNYFDKRGYSVHQEEMIDNGEMILVHILEKAKKPENFKSEKYEWIVQQINELRINEKKELSKKSIQVYRVNNRWKINKARASIKDKMPYTTRKKSKPATHKKSEEIKISYIYRKIWPLKNLNAASSFQAATREQA